MISRRYFDTCPTQEVTASLRHEPWPHLVLDGFLSQDAYEEAWASLGADEYLFEIDIRGKGRIEYSTLKSLPLWKALYSAEVISTLETAFQCRLSLNKQNLIQLRKMDDGTPSFPMHSDHIDGREMIVAFLYLSPGWTPANGGCLQLFDSVEAEPSTATIIEPYANRMIAFNAQPRHWHSVSKVRDWTRLNALIAWDVCPVARVTDQPTALLAGN